MILHEMAQQDMIIYVKGNTINIVKNRFSGDLGEFKNVKISIDVSGPDNPMMTIEDGMWERIRTFFKTYHPTRGEE